MANISLNIDGEVTFSPITDDNPCFAIHLSKNIGDNNDIPYARDVLNLHGDLNALERFVDRIREQIIRRRADLWYRTSFGTERLDTPPGFIDQE